MSNSGSNILIAKNTIVLNIRLVVVLAINLVISRLVLQSLGVMDYGLYTLVGGFVSLLSIVTSTITGTAQRFITYELGKGDERFLSRTFSNILNAIAVIALVVIILGVILGLIFIRDYLNIPPEKGNTALFVYFFSLITFVVNLLMVPYAALVNAHEHMQWYAIVSVIDAILKLVIVASLVLLPSGRVEFYALLLAFACIINLILYLFYCRRYFPESKYEKGFDISIIKQIISFSVWMGLGSTAGILKDQGGNILVNLFFGLALNASMGIANQIRNLLSQFANNIGMAIAPQITKSYAEGDVNRAVRLTFFRTKCQGIFILLIAIPVMIYTDEILGMWLGKVPEYSSIFVLQMCMVCIFNSLSQGYGPLFLAIGEIRNYQIFGSVLLLSYIPLTYFILKLTQDPRLCLLFNIFFELFFTFSNFYILKMKIDFPYLKFMREVIFRIFVSFMLTIVISFAFKEALGAEAFVSILIGILGVTLLFLIISYIIILDKSERLLVANYFKR